MKELVVISGKGGTGKTSLTAAFAALATDGVLCDADVDAADLHLLMDPTVKQKHEFKGGGMAVIDAALCTECGLCREKCRWDAITDEYDVDEMECEGCGVCEWMCPVNAITLKQKICGEWFQSKTRFGPMIHARLGIAEENSGRLVTLVRQQAKTLAKEHGHHLLITDGPPGIGCPVIASIGGASTVLIVAEPTISGLHDMERVAQLAAHFRVPAMLCVNKFDLNIDQAQAIEAKAKEQRMTVLDRIPFDPSMTHAMVQGKTILEYDASTPAAQAVQQIWGAISRDLETRDE